MSNLKLSHLTGLILLLSLFACNGGNDNSSDTVVTDTIPEMAPPPELRTSITFIMGDDKTAFNQYYEMAGHYYRLNADDHSDIVIDNFTSLSQVLDYLCSHPAPDSLPYGIVNLVSHGNEFIDLQMKVTPHGQRTSPESLSEALNKKKLKQPDTGIIDSATIVFLHGCAVGNNQKLLDALAIAFGGRATVMASKLFEYYAYLSPNKNPQSIRHYYARTWYAFYHPDSAYDEKRMVRQLRKRYPHDTVHWREGLRRRFQDNPAQIYHYSFIVPCSYEEVYASRKDFPSVGTAAKRQQWVESKSDFIDLMAKTHVPQHYFQIKFYRQANLVGDSIVLGLKVKARAGVICLIQPMTVTDSTGLPYAPYKPSLNDTSIFAYSKIREQRTEP